MRKAINDIYRLKYDFEDPYSQSEDFRKGFNAGVKVMMALFLEI